MVALCKLGAMGFCKPARYHRPYGMQHIFAGKVEGWRNLCLACRLLMPLLFHKAVTGQPKLYAADTMYDIVHARVAWDKTSQQCAVGRIDNCIYFERGNIPFPKHKAAVYWGRQQTLPIQDRKSVV